MFIKQTCAAIIAVSIIGLADAAAADDKQTKCTTYAAMATNQAVMAKHLKCGYSGQRWATDNNDHFTWCMGLTDPVPGADRQRESGADEGTKQMRPRASRSKPSTHS